MIRNNKAQRTKTPAIEPPAIAPADIFLELGALEVALDSPTVGEMMGSGDWGFELEAVDVCNGMLVIVGILEAATAIT